MSSYFDSKLLDEYDTIVFGPFIGDLYWEYLRWQSFIRWYTRLYPNKHYEIWTRNTRESLYLGIRANMITLDFTAEKYWDYVPEAYRLKGYPDEVRKDFIESVESLYTDEVLVLHPPYIDRDDFFNPQQMNKELLVSQKALCTINNILNSNPDKIPVVLAPSRNEDSVCERFWKQTYEKIANVGKHIVFIVGEKGIIEPDKKYPDFHIINDFKIIDEFGLSLCAIVSVKQIKGSVNNPYYQISKHIDFVKIVDENTF